IAESFRTYGAELGFTVATVFGGVGHGPQRSALARGVDVVVAAPGRLLDHLGERDADLSNVEIFVLDEADQMLDMGFIVPIRKIVKHLPKERQNLFFSATMPMDIGKLAGELLRDPVQVSVAPQATTAERVNQQVVFIEANRKRGLLTELFADPKFSRVLVFTRTKRGADKVARILEGGGVSASAIHGNKSQTQRERALAAFKAGDVRALVATDIAARGIDISSVTHVVQFELPDVPEQYVHRIGRTARAGAEGSAVAFCAEDERPSLRGIEKVTRQKIPATDRRNDSVLAQLSINADIEAKRGARAEPRGEAQPRHQQRRKPGRSRNDGRNSHRGDQTGRQAAPEHLQNAPRSYDREAGEGQGRSHRRSGKGGGSAGRSGVAANGNEAGGGKSNGASNRGQKSANHRKGQRSQDRVQTLARGDVMKVNAGRSSGPVMTADALMKHLSSGNPWSTQG